MNDARVWYCDSCGEAIACSDEGWVEWICVDQAIGQGPRLVHHAGYGPRANTSGGCRYVDGTDYGPGESLRDLELKPLLGPYGLVRLLSIAVAQPPPPIERVAELIMRLHVPDYEEARRYADQAVAAGVVSPSLPKGFYYQSQIKDILEFGRGEH